MSSKMTLNNKFARVKTTKKFYRDPTQQLAVINSPKNSTRVRADDSQSHQIIKTRSTTQEKIRTSKTSKTHPVHKKKNNSLALLPRYLIKRILYSKLTFTLASKIITTTLTILLIIASAVLWHWKRIVDSQFQSVDALDINSTAIRDRAEQEGDQTYLIVGVDSRAGANGTLGAGTAADADGSRSDTIILVDIPASRQRVIAVSFPRDLQITRPDCKGWDNSTGQYLDNTVTGEEKSKINAAYAYGGPKCLVAVIQNLSGLEINHFVGIDFSGFEHLVNDVGGVEVCTAQPIIDGQLGTVLGHTGKQVIFGQTALKYVRARKVYTEGTGDYGRIKRQQRFISSLLRSMLSKNTLSNPKKLNQLITDFTSVAFVQNITTNSLLELAQSIRNINAGHITMLTIPTVGTSQDGLYNEIPNIDSMNKIFDAIIDDLPLPGEPDYTETLSADPESGIGSITTTNTLSHKYTFTSAGINSEILVKVLNAGAEQNNTTSILHELANRGYWAQGIDKALTQSEHTIIRYSSSLAGSKNQAALIASLIKGARIQEDSTLTNNITVLLGKDFDDTLDTAPDWGSTITVPTLPAIKPLIDDNTSIINGADESCN